jgi:hypothetical protein
MLRPSAAAILTTTAGGLAIAGIGIAARRHMVTGASGNTASAVSLNCGWSVEEADDTSELSPYATAVVVRARSVPAARAMSAIDR